MNIQRCSCLVITGGEVVRSAMCPIHPPVLLPVSEAPQDEIDLEPIKARVKRATGALWFFRIGKVETDGGVMIGAVAPGHQIRAMPLGGTYPSSDGEFIAHARQDIPALIAEVERLRAALALPRTPERPRGESWHPIETAPKDGMDYVLALDDYLDCHVVCLDTVTGEWEQHVPATDRAERVKGLTHWMPLPDPPTERPRPEPETTP